MMKTLKLLHEILFYQTKMQTNLVIEFLEQMDDIEFSQIPKLLFTPDTKKFLDTYATFIVVNRKDKDELITRTIYFIGCSFFMVIV